METFEIVSLSKTSYRLFFQRSDFLWCIEWRDFEEKPAGWDIVLDLFLNEESSDLLHGRTNATDVRSVCVGLVGEVFPALFRFCPKTFRPSFFPLPNCNGTNVSSL